MMGPLADLFGWALLLSSLLAFAGRMGFPAELFGHWRMQIAGAALLGLAIAIALNHAFLCGCAASALANTVPVLFWTRAGARRADTVTDPAFTILWQNVGLKREAVDALGAYARETGADVIALCEPPLDMSDGDLAALLPEEPYLLRCEPDEPRTYDARIVIVSRRPIVAVSLHAEEGYDRRPHAVLRLEGFEAPIAVLHAASSAWPGGLKHRDATLNSLAYRMASEPRWVSIGDFNTTAWVPAFEVLRQYRLRPPWFRRTWRTLAPLFGLPLDHALVGGDLAGEVRYGPWNGSDHRILVLKLNA